MPGKGARVYPRPRIPEPDSIIPTPRCNRATIWTERYTIAAPLMPCEGMLERARSRIPKLDFPYNSPMRGCDHLD